MRMCQSGKWENVPDRNAIKSRARGNVKNLRGSTDRERHEKTGLNLGMKNQSCGTMKKKTEYWTGQ